MLNIDWTYIYEYEYEKGYQYQLWYSIDVIRILFAPTSERILPCRTLQPCAEASFHYRPP